MELTEHWEIKVNLPSYDPDVLDMLGFSLLHSDDGETRVFIPGARRQGQGRYMSLNQRKMCYGEKPTEALHAAVRKFEAEIPPAWAWKLAEAVVDLRKIVNEQ